MFEITCLPGITSVRSVFVLSEIGHCKLFGCNGVTECISGALQMFYCIRNPRSKSIISSFYKMEKVSIIKLSS